MVFAGIGFEVKGTYDKRRRDKGADENETKDRLLRQV